jgi:hypothetical protein
MDRTAPSDYHDMGHSLFSRWVGLQHTQMVWVEEQFSKNHIFLPVLVITQPNSERRTKLCGTAYYIIKLLQIVALVHLMALRYHPEGRGFGLGWCHWRNPSGRTLAVGSTQPIIRVSTSGCYLLEREGSPCVGLNTLLPSSAECLEIIGTLNSLRPNGLSRIVIGLLYLYLIV